jgi:hypothetical protein
MLGSVVAMAPDHVSKETGVSGIKDTCSMLELIAEKDADNDLACTVKVVAGACEVITSVASTSVETDDDSPSDVIVDLGEASDVKSRFFMVDCNF